MVTVARFTKPEDAHLLRLRLEAGGVDVFLADETVVQVDQGISLAMGGVRLQVAEEDVEQARAIMAEGLAAVAACPCCGSEEILPVGQQRGLLSKIVLHLLVIAPAVSWRCAACGHGWKAREPVAV